VARDDFGACVAFAGLAILAYVGLVAVAEILAVLR